MSNTATTHTRELASRQMQKIRGSQTLLSIFILLLVAIILWILISIVSSYQSSQIPADTKKLAAPLTPTISTEIFDSLENKRNFSDAELQNFPIYILLRDSRSQSETVVQLGRPLPATTPAPTSTPAPSPTATASPTPSSTGQDTTPEPADDEPADDTQP